MRFHRVAVLALLIVAAVALAWRWQVETRRAPQLANARGAGARVVTAATSELARATEAVRRADALARFAYAQAWHRGLPPPLQAFRDWTERYLTTPSGARAALEDEGVALARARRPVMRDLIIGDPERALAVTVPAAIRQTLPPAVMAELETRVAGRGEFSLVAAVPVPGEPPPVAMRRIVGLGGETYTAYVYGRREPQLTIAATSLHGIALDRHLALHESPLRLFEPGETLAGHSEPNCPVTDLAVSPPAIGAAANLAQLTTVAADGRTWEFCAGATDMLEAFARTLEQRENDSGPGSGATPDRAADATTAWTVGTRQVLVIRVDFPDIPGEPITLTTAENVMGPVKTIFEDMSYGLTSVVATTSSAVYRLPQTASAYATTGNVTQLHSDARRRWLRFHPGELRSPDRGVPQHRHIASPEFTGYVCGPGQHQWAEHLD